jgi:predicted transcriptional regulator
MTRTLHVQIGNSPDRTDLESDLEVVDEQGVKAVESRPSTMVFEDLETFGRVFRATNLELLEAIAEHEPTSIRELARIVDRNPPEVLDNVKELWQYGLVELEEKGRAKRPSVWYDEIEADLPLRQSAP